MGTIADTVMQHGGKAIGVIPQVLVEWERQHRSLTELLVVDNMHSRKKKMYELCDAAIVLPGGFGTLDELFEMVTWNQLSIHDKPSLFLIQVAFTITCLRISGKCNRKNFFMRLPKKD